MKRDFFISTYPRTKLNTSPSLGVSIFTNIQLVDYFLNSSTVYSSWIKAFSKRFPEQVKDDLHLLRTIFAHGVILRNFYLKNVYPFHQDWDAFIGWWEGLNDDEILDLINYGIKEAIAYYDKYLPSVPAVEKIKAEVSLEEDDLKDKPNRKRALEAALTSWSVVDTDAILPLYMDIKEMKKRIIRLLKGVWKAGFKEHWEKKSEPLSAWARSNRAQMSKTYGTNEEAIFTITGLYPDTTEIENINRLHDLTFIPVPNMGRLLSFVELDKHGYLMFDPFFADDKKGKQTKSKLLADEKVFEGLGHATRIQIIKLLAQNKEMFAQEIVTALNMKQSSISRHLNQLHEANLVSVRQEGNTKYFSNNQAEIQKVIETLQMFTH